MTVAVVLGTRPEAVKLAAIIEGLAERATVIHTGQHFDPSLTSEVYLSVGMREPDVVLDVGGSSRGTQIGRAVTALDERFSSERPDAVVVQGDTNAVVAGALAANALGVPLFHVEAGLRSYDRAMPEEHNRVVTDHLSDWLGAPTEVSRANLLAEGIDDARIEVTGNTIVEATQRLCPAPRDRTRERERLGLDGRYAVATFHRPENVDDPLVLATILDSLGDLPVPVVLALHPRTKAQVEAAGLTSLLARLRVVDPLGPRAFLGLCADAALLLTDSGGIQEEASVLKRPVLVVRRSTERPEVIGTFAERVEPGPAVSEVAARWLDEGDALLDRLAILPTPYGDGGASRRTVAAINRLLD